MLSANWSNSTACCPPRHLREPRAAAPGFAELVYSISCRECGCAEAGPTLHTARLIHCALAAATAYAEADTLVPCAYGLHSEPADAPTILTQPIQLFNLSLTSYDRDHLSSPNLIGLRGAWKRSFFPQWPQCILDISVSCSHGTGI
jgi:hypothetical protein